MEPALVSPSLSALTKARRILAFGALSALMLLLFYGPVNAEAETGDGGEGIIEHQVTESPSEVESSWTVNDIQNAIPLDSPRPPEAAFDLPAFPDASISAARGDFKVKDALAFPQRLQGKVFFRIGSLTYGCSATFVSSRYNNAIYTAGHCVFDRTSKRFVDGLIFVPGFRDGQFPLSFYGATNLGTTKRWAQKGSLSHDIGMATLGGTPFTDLGGARPVAFNLNPKKRKYTIYGYPAQPSPRFNGERLVGCSTRFAGRDIGRPKTIAAAPCHMGQGASGGGWLTKGYLNSVSSYIYCVTTPRACGFIFGPYFGKAAKRLYTSKAVGGSLTPIALIRKGPGRKITKRKAGFRFIGLASTPLTYWCKLDRRKFKKCRSRTVTPRLSRGRHVLKLKAYDQTGRRSGNTVVRKFRVVRG